MKKDVFRVIKRSITPSHRGLAAIMALSLLVLAGTACGRRAPAPSAAFSATPTSGEAPLTVNFTDSSTDATSWSWDFDNNGTADSTSQNPTYVYSTAGTYTVKLTVTGAGGSDDETKTDYITVTAPGTIEAGYTATPSVPPTLTMIRFRKIIVSDIETCITVEGSPTLNISLRTGLWSLQPARLKLT